MFSDVGSQRRLLQILCVLHFVDNSSDQTGTDSDKIWKLGQFMTSWSMNSLAFLCQVGIFVLMKVFLYGKGRKYFKQYIPNKKMHHQA